MTMTDTRPPACRYCGGAGEVGTGGRDQLTGVWDTRDCPGCDGTGCEQVRP